MLTITHPKSLSAPLTLGFARSSAACCVVTCQQWVDERSCQYCAPERAALAPKSELILICTHLVQGHLGGLSCPSAGLAAHKTLTLLFSVNWQLQRTACCSKDTVSGAVRLLPTKVAALTAVCAIYLDSDGLKHGACTLHMQQRWHRIGHAAAVTQVMRWFAAPPAYGLEPGVPCCSSAGIIFPVGGLVGTGPPPASLFWP